MNLVRKGELMEGFMIMFWNRKEVFMGYSLHKLREVRDILYENKIKYDYRIVNPKGPYLFSSRRARIGTYGEKKEYSPTYYVYVHKNDYEYAYEVLKNDIK
ncbi:MAG: hypothetical protein K0R54_4125 [Clostridiaceae bacterium]|jgi:hypothetical protein|nr:hypothetical protein [Clostridiaceae bacterium]